MKKVSVILASLLALPVIAFGVTTLTADSASAQLDLESGINSAKGTGAPDNVTEDDGLIKSCKPSPMGNRYHLCHHDHHRWYPLCYVKWR